MVVTKDSQIEDLGLWIAQQRRVGYAMSVITDLDALAGNDKREAWEPTPNANTRDLVRELRRFNIDLVVVTGRPLEVAERFVDRGVDIYASEGHETRIGGELIEPDRAEFVREFNTALDRVIEFSDELIHDCGYEPVEFNSKVPSDVLRLRHTGWFYYTYDAEQASLLEPRFAEIEKFLATDPSHKFWTVKGDRAFGVKGSMPPSPAQADAKAALVRGVVTDYPRSIFLASRPDDLPSAVSVQKQDGNVVYIGGGTFRIDSSGTGLSYSNAVSNSWQVPGFFTRVLDEVLNAQGSFTQHRSAPPGIPDVISTRGLI